MKTSYIALLISLLIYSPVAAEDSDVIERYREFWTSQFTTNMQNKVGAVLLKSGLSQVDVDRIIQTLAADAVTCLVDALVQVADSRSIEFESLISNPETMDIDPSMMDNDVFGTIAEPCILTALERAGVQLD